MSNEKQQLVAATAFKEMQTDIQVSMDDVVSAFVSEYENNLYARKKEITANLKASEKQLEKFIKEVRKEFTPDEYTSERMPFGLIITSNDGDFDWTEGVIRFKLMISKDGQHSYSNTINIFKEKKLRKALVKEFQKITEEASDLRADLSEVLVSLKSVARKERQVRGRIAVRKLEDSGYANLMQDSELAALVQLDD